MRAGRFLGVTMVHRLALRIIPQLNAVVTERDVRKRKRWIMLAPGLVAFILYRLLHDALPLSNPFVLLTIGGTLSTITACWAYAMGRQASVVAIFQTDGFRRLLWVGGWIGFVYGVHLSLLVLALLALFVDYNFLLHPDGPAMMALIISCTAVTRDAFEIGHVVRMESDGMRLVTFPDGGSFRELLRRDFLHVARWVGAGLVAGGIVVTLYRLNWTGEGLEIGQAIVVSVFAACFAHGAFLSARYPFDDLSKPIKTLSPWNICRFWVWPCFTFALTYYLVQMGALIFLLHVDRGAMFFHLIIGGVTAGAMAGYGYFLGARVFVEFQTHGGLSEELKRCPFVMEILAKTGWATSGQKTEPVAVVQGRSGHSREMLS